MIIFPIRTNIRPWRTPYVNYAIMIINALIFVMTYAWPTFTGAREYLRPFAASFVLSPSHPQLWQFLTYAFLHANVTHILGNMFFLYLFGNNVNDKLGHIGYICLYLAGAVFSGIGHSLLSSSPVLGASGAVAAVTGAYLVLFPQSLISVFYWIFFFLDTIEIPALYFIGFKLIFWDNIIERSIPGIAHSAHLSGYAFGIIAMLIMLSSNLIQASGTDLWSMIKQLNRRRRYRDVVSSGYDPFTGIHRKHVSVKEVKKSSAQKEKDQKISELRLQLNQRINERNLADASRLYIELINLDEKQIIPQDSLLDIANQLNSHQMYPQAAQAYESFITHYKNYPYLEQVELMVGLLYSRYLDKPDEAKKHLKNAEPKLTDENQKKMCTQELEHLK